MVEAAVDSQVHGKSRRCRPDDADRNAATLPENRADGAAEDVTDEELARAIAAEHEMRVAIHQPRRDPGAARVVLGALAHAARNARASPRPPEQIGFIAMTFRSCSSRMSTRQAPCGPMRSTSGRAASGRRLS